MLFMIIPKLDLKGLCENTSRYAMSIVETRLDEVLSDPLCLLALKCNPSALPILQKHNLIDWTLLLTNPNALDFVSMNMDKYGGEFDERAWHLLSSNTGAIHLLEQNLDKVDWWQLSANPAAIHIIEQNLDKVHVPTLCGNPNAVDLLEQNLDTWKLSAEDLSRNPNPKALDLLIRMKCRINWGQVCRTISDVSKLEPHMDKVNWKWLSTNPAAIHLIEQNMDKINWSTLSSNPAAIKLDTAEMMANIKPFAEELAATVFHPNRLARICEQYNIEFDELMDTY
jgi:hypothetical protein